MALEHCIAPFLDSCDVDDNHRITLKEWGKCLEIAEVRYMFYCDLAICDMLLKTTCSKVMFLESPSATYELRPRM